jgi:hypothetical protein
MPRSRGLPKEDLMCPLCFVTGSVLLTSAGSAGGFTAVAAKVLRSRRAKRQGVAEMQAHHLARSTPTSPDFPHPSAELPAQ